jgi:hybrid cluster-associated redox disulfide protein
MVEEAKITKDMTFGEVLKKHPETVKTFFEYGMHCFGCHLSVAETIEQGAMAHGVEVDKLIEDLNKTVSSSASRAEESSTGKKESES